MSLKEERTAHSTEIGSGTVIEGSIRTDGSLTLYGTVYGDIAGQGDLTLCGRVEGDVTGKNITLAGARIKGGLSAQGALSMDQHSQVEGDIQAESVQINGTVCGNVSVSDTLAMDACAVIAGSVCARSLSVAEGAAINGDVKIGESGSAETE